MQTKLLAIFTRTPLHVGAGASVGAVDQPVIRERHTRFPVIPGSGVKGVLADQYLDSAKKLTEEGEEIFGFIKDGDESDEKKTTSRSGSVSFGEARLLAFPLRSAKGTFALATCPLALSRFKRDAKLPFDIPPVADGDCLAGKALVLDNEKAALEEYVFSNKKEFPNDWAEKLSGLLDDAVLKEAKDRFILLSDGDFSYFSENACQVQHHNCIDDDTGVVDGGKLFNVETVPSETLFYAPFTKIRGGDAVEKFFERFSEETLLQFGGNSTTGLGFCTVKFI